MKIFLLITHSQSALSVENTPPTPKQPKKLPPLPKRNSTDESTEAGLAILSDCDLLRTEILNFGAIPSKPGDVQIYRLEYLQRSTRTPFAVSWRAFRSMISCFWWWATDRLDTRGKGELAKRGEALRGNMFVLCPSHSRSATDAQIGDHHQY